MVKSNPKGSKITPVELEDLIKASYKKSTDAQQIANKYNLKLDSELSSPEQKVFIDKKGKPIIAYRGSASSNIKNFTRDWLMSDVGILTGTSQYDPRIKRSMDVYEKVKKKYSNKTPTLIGHSLGGHIAELVGEKDEGQKRIITYNKGAGIGDIGKKINKDQTDIRTGGDLISALSLTQSGGKKITVKNTNFLNPIYAHKPDFISRIGTKIL
jgi:hypothetical protein